MITLPEFEYVEAKIGDFVWFYIDNHQGNLTRGKVVGIFPYYGENQYIIEIDTPADSYLIIRDSLSISDSKDKSIGLWRSIKTFKPH